MYFDGSMTIIYQENGRKCFKQKENFIENLTSGCHGYVFVGVPSKSTNLVKFTLLVSMETWSHDNSNEI